MPQFVEIINGIKRGGQVIDMHSRELQLRRKLVRHDHRRQSTLLFDAGVERQARTQQHHTVNLFGDNEINKGFFFLILMGAIADQHQIAFVGGGHFNAANHLTEEGIANIRHDHKDRPRLIAFHVTPERLR